HLARACLNSSIELAAAGKRSWAGDVLTAAKKLKFPIPPLDFLNATTSSVEAYQKLVEKAGENYIQQEVDRSDKLYMLQGRREPQKDQPAVHKTLYLRHYLSMVKTTSHRKALTSIMLSTHLLALERLRYVDHAHPSVPRQERVCRFCKTEVESPEHAMLECQASPEVLNLRVKF
ncbi:hypothetical protein DFH07DRAFT_722319, partial [Mycena maculata]